MLLQAASPGRWTLPSTPGRNHYTGHRNNVQPNGRLRSYLQQCDSHTL